MAGMRVKAKGNADDVLKGLDAFASKVELATTRAVNKLIEQAETEGLRKMAALYQIPKGIFAKYMRVRLAANGTFVASINARGQGLPLYLFKPRQIKGRGGGTKVTLRGRTFLIQHAFIARMKSGKVGIFARGAYGGKGKQAFTGESFGRFQFGRRRFSINELFTISAPGAFSHTEVTAAMNALVEGKSAAILDREIKFATR